MNKQQILQSVLGDLKHKVPGISGALIASKDGISMAQLIGQFDDPQQIASRAAATLALSRRMAESFKTNALNETTISGQTENIHLFAAAEEGVLVVIAPTNTESQLLQQEARLTAQEVARVLA